MKTELYLLRHGEPKLMKRLLGTTDLPVSDIGHEQMNNAAKRLKGVSLVVTSPLNRCLKFATIFSKENKLNCVIEEGFSECDFGEWDGMAYNRLNQEYSVEFERFINHPEKYSPPKGETLRNFYSRIEQAKNKMLTKYHQEKILLVTHSGVIRLLTASCLNMNILSRDPFQRLTLDYGSLTKINYFQDYDQFAQLVYLNR